LIFGIGTDIIEVDRVKLQLSKEKGLKEELFSPDEIEYCESKRYPEQHFAGKYAAKEAFFKATGTGWGSGYAFKQVEVLTDETGKPEMIVNGKAKAFITKHKIENIHVTVSHVKTMATATVILESKTFFKN